MENFRSYTLYALFQALSKHRTNFVRDQAPTSKMYYGVIRQTLTRRMDWCTHFIPRILQLVQTIKKVNTTEDMRIEEIFNRADIMWIQQIDEIYLEYFHAPTTMENDIWTQISVRNDPLATDQIEQRIRISDHPKRFYRTSDKEFEILSVESWESSDITTRMRMLQWLW